MARGLTRSRPESAPRWSDIGGAGGPGGPGSAGGAGGAVMLHAANGPDPRAIERCGALADGQSPTVVFVDLAPGAEIQSENDLPAFLAERAGTLRLVPLQPLASSSFLGLGDWLSTALGRVVLAPGGVPQKVVGGLFVPVEAGPGWFHFEPGRDPVPASRRSPAPEWECASFAEERELADGVRVEPLPAGAWITAAGSPRAAESYRKWLIGGLATDPAHPRVVVGHPGSAPVPLDAIVEFWTSVDERIRPALRFADFGATDPAGPTLGQQLADRLGVGVVAGVGVPVLAPAGSRREQKGSQTRTLLAGGAMHWRPYVWDLKYLPEGADPEPVEHRAPIEGLREVAPGIYEYAPGAVLEVTASGLMMRPPIYKAHAAAIRAAVPDPHHARMFHAADASVDADRMRSLADEAVARLEPEVRDSVAVLPSTAAVKQGTDTAGGEVVVAAVELAAAEVTVSAEAGAVVELEPAAASGAAADNVMAAESGAGIDASGLVDVPAEPEPVPVTRFRLESGPLPGDVAMASVPLAPVQETVTATSEPVLPIKHIEPAPTPAPTPPPEPAPVVPSTPDAGRAPQVQPVPRPETTAVPSVRALDQERQWVRRTLSEQYDNTLGSVSRVVSESPGLRTSGAATADVLVDLVAVQLYLNGQTRPFDDLVRSAAAGPHVPLARCIASGLKRLPSHRGPTLVRASLSERELRWYDSRKLVTEWGFVPALAGARYRMPGDVDLLIWSMTARRTHLVAPDLPEQVVFLPGTSFKVLSVVTGERPQVLLRELSASEIGADGRVDPGPVPLDEVALKGLTDAGRTWADEDSAADLPDLPDLPEAVRDRFGGAPGLIVPQHELQEGRAS
ncbi:hypothetical protein [Catenulispora rubra]|uniref:hypothetical protein n=1 Tax=Catenulispora rubra TaxID=280293 RepID=UPI001892567E|nr:hypothetical protein [Catenulispora rubra]